LHPEISARLTSAQNNIKELRLSVISEPSLFVLSHSLRRLDIHIVEDSHIDGLLDSLGRFGAHLERLSLSAEHGFELSQQIEDRAKEDTQQSPDACPT
jgi:hypothetical protein